MKRLIALSLLIVSATAAATCQDVYDPMSGRWVYVCKQEVNTNPYPVCHNEYDPMNGVWVLVCN